MNGATYAESPPGGLEATAILTIINHLLKPEPKPWTIKKRPIGVIGH